MIKSIKIAIFIIMLLSILLYFISDFLVNTAKNLYNTYHTKKFIINDNQMYSSVKFYDNPTKEWYSIEHTYILLISIGSFIKPFPPLLISIIPTILLIYIFTKNKA